MSTSTAFFPAAGHALFTQMSQLWAALFSAPAAKTGAAKPSPGTRLWNLYLKSAGMNWVDPALFADRIVQD